MRPFLPLLLTTLLPASPQPQPHPLDTTLQTLLTQNSIPGACLAVCHQNRLVYEKSFGLADATTKQPMRPDTRSRLASISKPITAIAILQLTERNRLSLDDKVYDILRPRPYPPRTIDPRLKQVTIRHLLHHTAGWDRAKSFDPMFRSSTIAAEAGIEGPATQTHIIRYMTGRPLDFDPGTRYAYSNYGYCLLGRVIERKTGLAYAEYTRQNIFNPLNMTSLAIGRSLRDGRLPNETSYHTPGQPRKFDVFPELANTPVHWPYGGFFLESMDSHGAWVGSTRDLMRLARDFDDPNTSRLLSAKSIATMFAPPPGPPGHDAQGAVRSRYYACGWVVKHTKTHKTFDHGGSLPGTATRLVRRDDGLHWALFLNARHDGRGRRLNTARIESEIWKALAQVKTWPDHDLFAATQNPPQPLRQDTGK